jgi:hypothetical protein
MSSVLDRRILNRDLIFAIVSAAGELGTRRNAVMAVWQVLRGTPLNQSTCGQLLDELEGEGRIERTSVAGESWPRWRACSRAPARDLGYLAGPDLRRRIPSERGGALGGLMSAALGDDPPSRPSTGGGSGAKPSAGPLAGGFSLRPISRIR